ncbi:MAG: hypothetical protein NC328_08505 [Muribaculum sp.]|nr:hypothetical protein [Muribaculum sp.]
MLCRNLLFFSFIASSAAVAAADVEFSYAPASAQASPWGTGRLTTYDVAVKIDDPFFAGSSVKGIRVAFPQTGGTLSPDCAVWASSALNLSEDGSNAPDIINAAGSIADGVLAIDFPAPVKVPDEGLYVGYTVTVTSLEKWTQKFPNPVVSSTRPGGMFVHTPDKYTSWTPMNSSVNAMRIVMDIPVLRQAVSPYFTADSYTRKSESVIAEVNFTSHSATAVHSLGYTVTAADKRISDTIVLDSPIYDLGDIRCLEIPLPAPDAKGDYPCTIEVTSVNGRPNEDPRMSHQCALHVLDFLPVHRPLMEEYTGFWCTGCPSAYVTLLEMHDAYPDLVAISIHNKDKITAVDSSKYPFYISGYPTVTINRNRAGSEGVETYYAREARKPAGAEVRVNIEWKDEQAGVLTANVDSRFIESVSGRDMRVGLCLVGNGMSDPSWVQRNSYYGRTDLTGQYWKPFVEGNGGVTGLIYDDVALIYPSMTGIAGSLPSDLERGKTYSYSYDFNLEDAVCCHSLIPEYGKNLVQDKDRLRVVAFIYDYENQAIVNSAVSDFAGGSSGVSAAMEDDDKILTREYYNFSGMRLQEAPAHGIFVEVIRMEDGTTRSNKIIR